MSILETYYTYAKLVAASYIGLSQIGDTWRTSGFVDGQLVVNAGDDVNQENANCSWHTDVSWYNAKMESPLSLLRDKSANRSQRSLEWLRGNALAE